MGYFGFAGVTSGVIWDGASQNERFRSSTRRAKPENGNMGFGVNSHARRVTLSICG
ncbi:hypothetical protein K443DRAFT_681768 [Laccaria amethystina LaAM-08-1]|uniref:Uncharacterized protein n=1 Tax=Laccaria amethystina LaAM-08-1 TaxID=1095629 RepID=A0A0C9X701_9AGAR|nr:hypothetical protein K443DRAFT_681768 [Laccaria amethystina LaAM-08-1]